MTYVIERSNVLNEQEVLKALTHSLTEPEQGDTEQHKRDFAAFENWHKKDRCALFTMLSSMHSDLSGEFMEYPMTQDMWKALRLKYDDMMVLLPPYCMD